MASFSCWQCSLLFLDRPLSNSWIHIQSHISILCLTISVNTFIFYKIVVTERSKTGESVAYTYENNVSLWLQFIHLPSWIQGNIITNDLAAIKYLFYRVFHDKIKFHILGQNLHQTCFSDYANDPSRKREMVHETNFSLWFAK